MKMEKLIFKWWVSVNLKEMDVVKILKEDDRNDDDIVKKQKIGHLQK